MRKNIINIATLFCCCCLLVHCRNEDPVPPITFMNTYHADFVGRSIVQTDDGGYAITGGSEGDIFLLRTDQHGNQLPGSPRLYNTGLDYDNGDGNSIIQTRDGGFAITGDPGYLYKYVLFIRTNSSGDPLFDTPRLIDLGGHVGGHSIVPTNEGGFAITGGGGMGTKASEIFLLLTDKEGNPTTGSPKTYGLGGAQAIIQTSDGGYAIVGDFKEDDSVLLLLTNASGDARFGFPKRLNLGSDKHYANDITQTADGGFAIAGQSCVFTGGSKTKILFVRTDNQGNPLPGSFKLIEAGEDASGFSIIQTGEGHFAIVGISSKASTINDESDIVLLLLNGSGDLLPGFPKYFDGGATDYGTDIIQTDDGGFAITGWSEMIPGSRHVGRSLIIKTDANGEVK